MSEKPSLYVVERKEVVILVVLFILVTVLSFTVGVRYGEKIGRKLVNEDQLVLKEKEGASIEKNGGTLGEAKLEHAGEMHAEKTEKSEKSEKPEKSEKADKLEKVEKVEKKVDDAKGPVSASTLNAVDANSDEALLSALKGTSVEPPSGKSIEGSSLPEEAKSVKAGMFVIQVGSHPTKREAEEQIRNLKNIGISDAQILPAYKDKQGEWFRVVVGSYKNKNEAEKHAKQWKDKGLVRNFFVRRI